jgi:hypothetical protein
MWSNKASLYGGLGPITDRRWLSGRKLALATLQFTDNPVYRLLLLFRLRVLGIHEITFEDFKSFGSARTRDHRWAKSMLADFAVFSCRSENDPRQNRKLDAYATAEFSVC